MSSYMVIQAVSEALRQILWQEFEDDPLIQPIVANETAIVFTNPTETHQQPSNRLSLWLYRVTENEFLKNQPATRANGANSTRPAPLALNLDYLVTPVRPLRRAGPSCCSARRCRCSTTTPPPCCATRPTGSPRSSASSSPG